MKNGDAIEPGANVRMNHSPGIREVYLAECIRSAGENKTMNCLYEECTEKNENQKKKKCCLIMREGKENKNDAPLGGFRHLFPSGFFSVIMIIKNPLITGTERDRYIKDRRTYKNL
jgi:hypothetical protein